MELSCNAILEEMPPGSLLELFFPCSNVSSCLGLEFRRSKAQYSSALSDDHAPHLVFPLRVRNVFIRHPLPKRMFP